MLKPLKIIVFGFVLMFGFGVFLTYYYYENSTYPLQETADLSFVFATLIWTVGLMGLTEVLRQKFT